jgi:hypothetical protein
VGTQQVLVEEVGGGDVERGPYLSDAGQQPPGLAVVAAEQDEGPAAILAGVSRSGSFREAGTTTTPSIGASALLDRTGPSPTCGTRVR